MDAYLGIYILNYKPKVDLDLLYILSFWLNSLGHYIRLRLVIYNVFYGVAFGSIPRVLTIPHLMELLNPPRS